MKVLCSFYFYLKIQCVVVVFIFIELDIIVFLLDLYLIYSKGIIKLKIIFVLVFSVIIVKRLMVFRLQRFFRKVYNLVVFFGFRLKWCYFCFKVNFFIKFYRFECVCCVEGEGRLIVVVFFLMFLYMIQLQGMLCVVVVFFLRNVLYLFIYFV